MQTRKKNKSTIIRKILKRKDYNSYLIYVLHKRRRHNRHNSHKLMLKSSKILTFKKKFVSVTIWPCDEMTVWTVDRVTSWPYDAVRL